MFRFFEGELFAIIFAFYVIITHAFLFFGSLFAQNPVRSSSSTFRTPFGSLHPLFNATKLVLPRTVVLATFHTSSLTFASFSIITGSMDLRLRFAYDFGLPRQGTIKKTENPVCRFVQLQFDVISLFCSSLSSSLFSH